MVPGPREAAKRLSASPVPLTWVASRGVVLAALLAAFLTRQAPDASLLAWDAAWYRDLAERGYSGMPAEAVRYFPIWPWLAHALSAVSGVPPGLLLVVLANIATLGYLALARRVAIAERLGPGVAERVPAVVAFAPAGFVLVMGYSEALFGVLLGVALLGARREHWLACAAAGLLAGALRPTGVLLCLPMLIEGWQGIGSQRVSGVAARLAAVCAPAVGLGLYLAWAWRAYGDPLAPFHAQLSPSLRGGVLVNPLTTLADDGAALLSGRFATPASLHLIWLAVSLWLLVVCARRLPASFTAFAVAVLFLAVTARNFGSFERYACSALPLLLAAAIVLAERPRLSRCAAVAAPAVLFGHALFAFLGWYVP